MYDKTRRAQKRGRGAGVFVLVLLVLLIAGAASVWTLVQDLPNPSRLSERAVVESTRIYDRTGTVLLYEVHGDQRRTVIPFDQIPDSVKHATLAAEDLNFYRHAGLDWRGILRAIATNVVRGNFSQGGSTITQQLVKNSILGPEKTIQRKIREQILALLLERRYTKNEIFGFYLNQIPYGSNAYGISAAADMYFAKKPGDLTLAEAAALASLPKAPTYYSPYGSHKRELLDRKDWVLDRMADAGFVSRKDTDAAKTRKIVFVPPHEFAQAPHFVQYVRDYLNKKYGEQYVEQGGLNVTTTLDWTLQEQAETVVREGAEANDKLVQAANAALVAVDPRTGEILAMAGSRDYNGTPLPAGCTPGVSCAFDPYVNIATRPRQPGSAFKPFVYATALAKGYTPDTVLFDVATEFNPTCNPDGTPGKETRDPKSCYRPQDYDGSFRGPVRLRQALAQSLNVPSVKLLYLAGIGDSIKTAQEMGITTLTDPDRYGLSLVLGGAEVTLLDLTSAFGVFAADGVRHPAAAVLKVETSKGDVLEEKQDVSMPVLDSDIARTINAMLSDNAARVPVFSPQSSLYFPDRPVAAKTGTTQDYRDAWTVGYTPTLAAGVWVGNSDNTPMNQKGLSVMVAGPIWHKFMAGALATAPPEDFAAPEKTAPADAKPVFRGIWGSGATVKIDKISRKLATASTPPELVEEIGFGKPSTILALVDRSDPGGEAPLHPESDPQYANWQAGIDLWFAAHGISASLPPTDYDSLHTSDAAPRIAFLSPENDAGDVRSVAVRVVAAYPLREVSLFVDGALASSRTAPFTSSDITLGMDGPLSSGTHTLTVTAYDAVGNRGTAERMVRTK